MARNKEQELLRSKQWSSENKAELPNPAEMYNRYEFNPIAIIIIEGLGYERISYLFREGRKRMFTGEYRVDIVSTKDRKRNFVLSPQ